jgi:transposase
LDQEVKESAQQDPLAQLLMTLPGVGPVVAMTFLAEVGDIRRFKPHRQLAAYVGMVPCLDSSAGKNRLGHNSKQGSAWLRSALVDSAQVVANSKGRRLNSARPLFFDGPATGADMAGQGNSAPRPVIAQRGAAR